MRSRSRGALRRAGVSAAVAFAAVAVVPGVAEAASAKTWIVQLKAPAMASYTGGTRGIPATNPQRAGTRKLDTRSAAAQAYKRYLDGRQNAALARLNGARPAVLYSYRYAFAGFSANLTAQQKRTLAHAPEVLHIFENTKRHVTAVDPDDPDQVDAALGGANGDGASFLGLPHGLWNDLSGADQAGDGVIVGDIDTGITPESASFADQSNGNTTYVGPDYQPPELWNGTCQAGDDASWDPTADCNNKLIGARWFVDGFGADNIADDAFKSPRDDDGHGSHTSATAAGNFGVDPSIFGNDLGVDLISGIAPRAYVAEYKICWPGNAQNPDGCANSDAVAAVDKAISDGVDVLNYSIGGTSSELIGADSVAFLGARDAGVFVANSAGNAGPGPDTVGSPGSVPWMTSVAAETLGRTFAATSHVVPTTGAPFDVTGSAVGSLDPGPLAATEIVSGKDSGKAGVAVDDAAHCFTDTLDPAKVTGKVVLCRGDVGRAPKSKQVRDAGGVGMILANDEPNQSLLTDVHWVPANHVTFEDGNAIDDAIDAGTTTITIPNGTAQPAQGKVMASFSSRGPQDASPDIAKPDITAPGVNILAAAAPDHTTKDDQVEGNSFQSISGTSMSSPHVAGAGALLTAAHPTWSPEEIKSALMTTADPSVKKEDGTTDADPFDQGSGSIDPTKAADPGLVLDAGHNDYLEYLEGIDPTIVSGDIPTIKATDLNLPSISASKLPGRVQTSRTFTSVDNTKQQWTVTTEGLTGLVAKAAPEDPTTPNGDTFQIKPGQTETVDLDITNASAPLDEWAFGALVLTDGSRTVRLPISVKPVKLAAPSLIKVTTDQAAGSQPVPVAIGYDGQLNALGFGLAAPQVKPGETVGQSPSGGPVFDGSDTVGQKMYTADVPAGAQLLSMRISNADGDADPNTDLDLYLFRDKNGDNLPQGGELVDLSASSIADEGVTEISPDAGHYMAIVVGFTTQEPSTYDFTTWVGADNSPDDMTNAPGLRLSGDPFDVSIGDQVSPSLDWSGVDAKGLYLGVAGFYTGQPGSLEDADSTALVELTKGTDTSGGGPTPPGGGGGTPTPPGGGNGGGTPGPKLTIKASKLRLAHNRRSLRARIKLSRAASVTARAARGRSISRSGKRSIKSGTHTVTFRLKHKLKRGKTYSVRFTALAKGQPVARKTVHLRVPRH
jgi:subtilisin family serine protease